MTARRQQYAPRVPGPMIRPGPRCGWPDEECKLPDRAHQPEPGHRDIWMWHTPQCQIPNPNPGPHFNGYPTCCMAMSHGGECCYQRHAADGTANDHRIYS
jgi:hypothetical protein